MAALGPVGKVAVGLADGASLIVRVQRFEVGGGLSSRVGLGLGAHVAHVSDPIRYVEIFHVDHQLRIILGCSLSHLTFAPVLYWRLYL